MNNHRQFSKPQGLSEMSMKQMRLLHSQGMTPDKIAMMFGVSPDALSFLEDVAASNGKPENLKRRMRSHIVTK